MVGEEVASSNLDWYPLCCLPLFLAIVAIVALKDPGLVPVALSKMTNKGKAHTYLASNVNRAAITKFSTASTSVW